MQTDEHTAGGRALRRGLNIWEAIGISVALMAPSMAANINPQATAGSVGRAVPLAFALATVGVLLVAYAFVRLCQHYHHAGSVYGFVGATLGARAGLVAGWALLGTYTFYGVVTSVAAGIFGSSFLEEIGVWTHPPSWTPFLIGAIALAGVYVLTVTPVRNGTRILLTEARHPRRDIPRAILGTAIFGGVYFVTVTATEMMGFGTDAAGVASFAASGSLFGDLGSSYIGGWVGDLITIGAAISAFGCALACAVGASRLAFAFSRDGVGPARLATVSVRRGTPHVASAVVVTAMYLIIVVDAIAFGAKPFDVFLWSGTIGTLILLVAYGLTIVGAMRLLFFSGRRLASRAEIVIPVLALLVIGYTLYRNVLPYPTGAGAWFPVVCGVWLLAAVVFVLARPGIARRAGRRLTAEQGLAGSPVPGIGTVGADHVR
jgi:amino acid transporter